MSISSYQPFLIGSGQTKTGLFQYLESWVAPEDAFTDLQDAYINRGQIWKRDGQTLLGVLTYCTTQVLAYGTGIAGPYTGDLSGITPRNAHLPILAGSVTIKAREVGNVTETFTDNGAGVLTGDMLGSGSIDYVTGLWSITGGAAINNSSPIMIDYTYTPTTANNTHAVVSVVALAPNPGIAGPYSGTYTQNLPILAGTAFITVFRAAGGLTTYLDDGAGNFRDSLPAGTIRGTIDYNTGAWTFTAQSVLSSNSSIQLGFTSATTTRLTIMGITQWNDESNNTFDLVVEDTRRAAVYNVTTQLFDPLCEVNETLFITNGTTPSFDNGDVPFTPTFQLIAPLSITLTLWNTLTGVIQDTAHDDGAGGFPDGTLILPTSTIDYFTGEFKVQIDAGSAANSGWAINASFTLQNDYFTGDQSNFFNWTNWEPSANRIVTQPAVGTEKPTQFEVGFLYLTNGVDPITLYHDGKLSRPAFAIRQVNLGLGKNEILNALDVKTFASRLLIVRPTTTIGDGNPDPQSIRWSAQFQPTNTVADIPGSGGELSAATSDWINSTKFLKDFIVVNFQNSVWLFRFTGSAFAPFQFFKINTTKNTSAPYGSIEFDDQVTAMGSRGLIYCDGVAVDRYDLKIFDQFESINSEAFIQCFGQRFDILNQAWMLYPDAETDALLSTKVLLWNYLEDSWATFNMPLSCLGFGFGVRDLTWADFAPGGVFGANGLSWQQADFPWNSYLTQKESLRLLGGDFVGQVLQLNDGPTDVGTEIRMSATTKKYNPFAQLGVKAQFGYLDVYYTVNEKVELTFQFYIDNSEIDPFNPDPDFEKRIFLTGTPNAEFGWKRIFINVQTAQIQWNITDNGVTGFRILGQILWASPAGRITE